MPAGACKNLTRFCARDPAAYRVRSLIGQLGLSRAAAAALLRELAVEFDSHPAAVDAHLRAAAEHEAASLRSEGFTVTTALEVRTLGAAQLLGRSSGTLRNWRAAGSGPAWRSEGGVVFYSLLDLLAWRRGE